MMRTKPTYCEDLIQQHTVAPTAKKENIYNTLLAMVSINYIERGVRETVEENKKVDIFHTAWFSDITRLVSLLANFNFQEFVFLEKN